MKRIGLGIALVAAPAQAECLGSCADDLAAALASMLVYGVIGIVLLVMLIRAKWRRAGLWGLWIVAVLALGVPLLSQGWIAWKLRAVEAREVVDHPPPLTILTPLLITPDEYCEDSACEAVLSGRGGAGAYVVLTRALDGMDLSASVALSKLPMELWTRDATTGEIRRRALIPAERYAAAGRIDYLVVTSWPYYPADPGPVEAALQQNPMLDGMGDGEAVRLLLAPLSPGDGLLSLATLKPDVLDLTLLDKAMAIPLAPRNTQSAENTVAGLDAAEGAICPSRPDPLDQPCRSLLER